MLWLLIAGFFCWLILREFLRQVVTPAGYDGPDPTPISKSYVLTMAALAILFAYSPVRYWQFERMLSAKARILSWGGKIRKDA